MPVTPGAAIGPRRAHHGFRFDVVHVRIFKTQFSALIFQGAGRKTMAAAFDARERAVC
jgi:hypothetical protein